MQDIEVITETLQDQIAAHDCDAPTRERLAACLPMLEQAIADWQANHAFSAPGLMIAATTPCFTRQDGHGRDLVAARAGRARQSGARCGADPRGWLDAALRFALLAEDGGGIAAFITTVGVRPRVLN